jgi:arsenite methyltransferase
MPEVKQAVRERYGAIASSVSESQTNPGCCGPAASCCGTGAAEKDMFSRDLYDQLDVGAVPEAAVLASLGCGNPTALAQLHAGERVLDLGSGGGIDVLLSAKRVGPTGFVYGLDMTDEMLALAERNKAEAGATNVEFLKGDIEAIPLPDDSVDVIISNCVINLAADKDRVLNEAFRVLKPGGRFAVSDVVVRGQVPDDLRRQMEAWVGCIAGALSEDDYRSKLAAAGFADISLETTRVYSTADVPVGAWQPTPQEREQLDGKFVSAFVRAIKPAA